MLTCLLWMAAFGQKTWCISISQEIVHIFAFGLAKLLGRFDSRFGHVHMRLLDYYRKSFNPNVLPSRRSSYRRSPSCPTKSLPEINAAAATLPLTSSADLKLTLPNKRSWQLTWKVICFPVGELRYMSALHDELSAPKEKIHLYYKTYQTIND